MHVIFQGGDIVQDVLDFVGIFFGHIGDELHSFVLGSGLFVSYVFEVVLHFIADLFESVGILQVLGGHCLYGCIFFGSCFCTFGLSIIKGRPGMVMFLPGDHQQVTFCAATVGLSMHAFAGHGIMGAVSLL